MALIQCDFFSKSLMRTVNINVILPTDKITSLEVQNKDTKLFKTLYLLHGIIGNFNDWVIQTRIRSWAEKKNVAVVMPSGENSFYVDKNYPGGLYATFIKEELVEFTRKTFPLSPKKEDTFIGGLSMGGYGAIINGLNACETFGYICALSAAIRIVDPNKLEAGSKNIFNSKEYFEATFGNLNEFIGSDKDCETVATNLIKNSRPLPKIYIACGVEDFLFKANQDFKDKLISLDYDVTWVEDKGGHDWNFWDKYIQKVLDWLPLDENVEGISSGNIR